MSSWLANTISEAEQVQDWLSPKRAESLAQLKNTPWPNRKTEAWRYTPINVIERARFSAANDTVVQATAIENLDSIDLVFIDGVFDAQASTIDFPEGLCISQLSEGGSCDWALDSFKKTKPNKHFL